MVKKSKNVKGGGGPSPLTPEEYKGVGTIAVGGDPNYAKPPDMYSSNQVGGKKRSKAQHGGMSYGFANTADVPIVAGSYVPVTPMCTAKVDASRGGNNFMSGGAILIGGSKKRKGGAILIGGSKKRKGGAILIGGSKKRKGGAILIGGSKHNRTQRGGAILIGGKRSKSKRSKSKRSKSKRKRSKKTQKWWQKGCSNKLTGGFIGPI